ncbi:MAG: potassium transporter TrkG [Candidatus Micrarchaeota archaeon]
MRLQEFFSTLSVILFYSAIPLILPLGYAYYYNEPSFTPIWQIMALMMLPAIPWLAGFILKKIWSFFTYLFKFIFRKEPTYNFAFSIISKPPEISSLKFGDILSLAAICWIIIPIIWAYPYYVAGMQPIDAIFESFSGWTTTGLSTISSFASFPDSIILYRSLTQWIGGLGIIFLMLTFLRHRQAKNLLASEGKDTMELGSRKTALTLWRIYLILTLLSIAALFLSGMGIFNSVNIAFAGISTGGFLPFASFPFLSIQKLIMAATMFLGATSFVTHNKIFSGNLSALWSEEFRLYVLIALVACAIIFYVGHEGFEETYLNGISALSSTGFTLTSLALHPLTIYILILLMIFGGMYGSTAGGLKIWRILLATKLVLSRIREYFLPQNSVQAIKIDGVAISDPTIRDAMGFIFIYLMLFLACSGAFLAWGYSLQDSIFTVSSAIGNVGLATVDIAPMGDTAKILLSALMYLGRIEILPVLALLRLLAGRV